MLLLAQESALFVNVFRSICLAVDTGVLCGSVVRCLTHNPVVMSLADPMGFSWECPWARHFRQSSGSCKIVRESRINEIKHVQTDKPLREFTHKNHLKRHFRSDRFS